jgi:CBS domain containing-hemolysin-like protein
LLLAIAGEGWLAGPAGDALVALALLIGSAFFSGAETALVSASRARLEAAADRGRADAKRAIRLIERTPRALATVLVGTNLCNIGLSSFVTALAVGMWAERGPAIATIALTPVVLFFAEILPKAFFRTRPTRLLRGSSVALEVSGLLFAPLVALASGATRVLLFVLRVPPEAQRPAFRREDLEAAFLFGGTRDPERGAADASAGAAFRMAGRALVLAERKVSEVMAPVEQGQTVPADARVGDAIERFRRVGGRHLAVVDDQGGIVGFVAAKHLLGEAPGASLPVRAAWTLAPDDTLDDVMQGLRRHQQAIGVVRDRDGRTLGVVRPEDVFEGVVGELTGGGRSGIGAARRGP